MAVANTLHLTLKKQWFDMIASGEKKEEYREVKEYWLTRLAVGWIGHRNNPVFKCYDTITFRNGYSKEAPTMVFECLGISIGTGNPNWGAPNENVFVIKLGQRIS